MKGKVMGERGDTSYRGKGRNIIDFLEGPGFAPSPFDKRRIIVKALKL
jgi:hypothetical protein